MIISRQLDSCPTSVWEGVATELAAREQQRREEIERRTLSSSADSDDTLPGIESDPFSDPICREISTTCRSEKYRANRRAKTSSSRLKNKSAAHSSHDDSHSSLSEDPLNSDRSYFNSHSSPGLDTHGIHVDVAQQHAIWSSLQKWRTKSDVVYEDALELIPEANLEDLLKEFCREDEPKLKAEEHIAAPLSSSSRDPLQRSTPDPTNGETHSHNPLNMVAPHRASDSLADTRPFSSFAVISTPGSEAPTSGRGTH